MPPVGRLVAPGTRHVTLLWCGAGCKGMGVHRQAGRGRVQPCGTMRPGCGPGPPAGHPRRSKCRPGTGRAFGRRTEALRVSPGTLIIPGAHFPGSAKNHRARLIFVTKRADRAWQEYGRACLAHQRLKRPFGLAVAALAGLLVADVAPGVDQLSDPCRPTGCATRQVGQGAQAVDSGEIPAVHHILV